MIKSKKASVEVAKLKQKRKLLHSQLNKIEEKISKLERSDYDFKLESDHIWARARKSLRTVMRPGYFKAFILSLKVARRRDGTWLFKGEDRFSVDWVQDHYFKHIERALSKIQKKEVRVVFQLPSLVRGGDLI